MKHKAMLVAILLTILTQFDLHSQERLKKGNYFIGGGIWFSTREYNQKKDHIDEIWENNRINYSFSPYLGKFIKEGLAVGLKTYIARLDEENKSGSMDNPQIKVTEHLNIGAGFFLKKFWSLNDKFGFFATPTLGFEYGNSESETKNNFESSIQEGRSDQFYLSSGLGVYYFISPRFSVESYLASIRISKKFNKELNIGTNNGSDFYRSSETNDFNFHFINELSLDQIIVINYYF